MTLFHLEMLAVVTVWGAGWAWVMWKLGQSESPIDAANKRRKR